MGLLHVSLLNPPTFSIDWSKLPLSPSSLAWDHIWQTVSPKLDKRLRKDFCPAWIWTALCIHSLDSHLLIPHSLTLEVMNKSPSSESGNLLYCLHWGDFLQKTSISPWTQLNSYCSVAQGHSGWWYSVFQPRRTWCHWWISLVLWKLIG